jgi:hypothetical protein
MVEALNANTKAGRKLILELVEDGVVTAVSATAAGFNVISSITGYNTTGYTMVYQGSNPLPATVTAVYSDGTTASVGVTWSAFSTTVEGTYDVTGTVAGYGTITTKVTLTKTLVVSDAYPSGVKEITVTFNMPVPTATAVTCKFGAAVLSGLTQTWSTDRKTLKISRTYNFTAGTYTITAATSTKDFVLENEKLTEINLAATNLYPQTGAQDLNVTFYNQYGSAMNPLSMSLQLTAFSPQKPTVTFSMNKTATSVTISGVENLAVGDTVNLFVIDNATAQAVTKTITIVAAPTISAFSFGTLTIASSATRILTGTSGHTLSVFASDQYGNAYKLRTGNQDIYSTVSATVPLFITSTDSTVVNPALIEVNANGELFFKPGAISASKGGTVTLTVMSPMNPAMSNATFTMTVYEPASIYTLQIQGVSATMYASQWTPVVAFAYDQYSNFLALENINTTTNLAKLTLISSNGAVIPSGNAGSSIGIRYNTATKLIEVYGAGSGTTTVMISYDGRLQSTMSLTVAAAAAPSQLSAVSIPAVFQKTASATLNLSNYTISDQYGAPITLTTGYSILVASSAGLTITNPTVTTANPTTTITAPNTAANYDLVFTLKDPSNNTLSSQSFSIQVVDAAGISSYQFETIGTMYSKAPTNPDYYKLINITGRTATGISVQLVYDGATGLPVGINNITSSNSAFTTTLVGGRLYLKANYSGPASSVSTTLKALYSTGLEAASTTATALIQDPYMYNLYLTETTKTMSIADGVTHNFLTYLAAKDQYGVTYSLGTTEIYYFTSNSAVVSVDNATDTFTLVASGACTLRAIFPATGRTLEMVINVTN